MRSGHLITIPAFAEPRAGVRHFFGTRPDGADPPGHNPVHDTLAEWASEGAHRRQNRRDTTPITAVSVRQVHGTDSLVLDRIVAAKRAFDGAWDALVTNCPRVLLTVRTADCVPLLVHDPVKRVVAAVHAGWRGAVAGIVGKTLQTMRRKFGSSPDSLRLGIGPSVGPCCYEVDGPVLDRLRANFRDWQSVARANGRGTAMLDLRTLVRRQAELQGVRSERIRTVPVCTMCHPELFYSYRRDGTVNGSMLSGIMLTHG